MATPLIILLLVLGIVLVVLGADWLVDGASDIAKRFGVSDFIIGLTIVGFGTSCPELVVSLTGAFQGLSDIAIGNVLGSNIFNTLLVLGLTAVIMPVAVTSLNKTRDIPVMLLGTFLLLVLGFGGEISRVDGAIFIVVFAAYMYLCFRSDSRDELEAGDDGKARSIWASIGLVLLGLVALVAGGQLGVDYGVELARRLGVSEKFIAVTMLAGGTSLPELAACVVAAAKKKGQMALGNIVGSNLFNMLLIIGSASLVSPVSFASVNLVDASVLLASACLVWMSSYTFKKDRIDRFEGAIFLAVFAGYYIWLFTRL